MRRIVAGLAGFGLAASIGHARADDGPPPLTAPVVGPVAEPAASAPAAAPLPAAPPRQVLAIPGLTAPRSTSRSLKPARPSSAPVALPPAAAGAADPLLEHAPDGLPPLIRPPGRGTSAPRLTPRGAPARPGGLPPITLESVPADDGAGDGVLTREPAHADSGAGAAGTVRPSPRPGPVRRPAGLFGRLFPGATAGMGLGAGPVDRPRAGSDSIRIEPRTDPAADAAAKRRIESQLRDRVGPRLRSYEVRVVGREVVIRARASRFWQRRGIRKDLEALPALTGYRATVEVFD